MWLGESEALSEVVVSEGGLGRAEGDDPLGEQHHRSCVLCVAQLVCRHHDGDTTSTFLFDDVSDESTTGHVESCGWFVE